MAETLTASDGLPARVVEAHSFETHDRHGMYCATFDNAMRSFWKAAPGSLR